jgi:signal transduction histidine kinase
LLKASSLASFTASIRFPPPLVSRPVARFSPPNPDDRPMSGTRQTFGVSHTYSTGGPEWAISLDGTCLETERCVIVGGAPAGAAEVGLRSLLDRVLRRRAKLVPEERLRFETLLSDLSAGLIHLAAADVDAAIERGLQQVVTFLGVDRGQLDEYVGSEPVVRIVWTRPGLEDMPRLMDDDQFPWTAETLRRGQVVRFSRIDELPAAAALDQANLRRAGTRSKICLPLRASGPMLGVLSLGAVRAERAWPDDLVERLRLLSAAFSNALERKRMELSLAERLRFERLLSSLSAAFSHLLAADFDREVQRGLRQVVDFLGVDRGSLIEFSRDGTTARSWAIEEWMDVGEFPWMAARLRSGDVVRFAQLEELPDEAAVDRRSYLSNRVKPQVAVPLLVSGIVVGGLVFGTVGAERARSDELIERLHLLGEIFANALSRKQGELEAQRLRQDLTHIGRVSALGELTASLAHELNQPLTAILSNAQAAEHLLTAAAPNLEEVREILRDIVTDDRRATEVIRRLRALVKKGDLEFVPLDLNELIREVARLMGSDAISRGISLSLELAADLPTVRGDRVQLQQVVLNLVLNGLDAMHEPGGDERTLVIRTARDGADAVAVSVQDAGTGIDEKNVDQLFHPLFTTKTEGLGMGLTIARTIVDAHGGRLSAANNVTAGATFQFSLPVSREGVR